MATKMGLPGMEMMKGVGLGPLNIGNVLDTMGFVKKAWGAMNAPSSFMPTIDVEELNKRIVDLQAVEQWLMMNLSMIQGSIQALEVQRATIETLKGVTKGMMPGNFSGTFPGMVLSPESFRQASQASPAPDPEPLASPRATRAAKAARPGPKGKQTLPGPAGPDPGLSATAWLEFLQGQFNQVTQAAMSGAPLKAANKMASKVTSTAAKTLVKAAPSLSRKKAPAARKGKAAKSKS